MDINALITYLLTPVAQVALIMGIAEVIKRQELFENKFIFLIDLILGLAFGVGIYSINLGYPIFEGILIGLALGLSACGLFSGIKNMREAYDEPEFVEDEEDEY